ncbi:MAG: nitroreductase/quinone reductase family protein [Candidatus Limnocylindrales bacterium]
MAKTPEETAWNDAVVADFRAHDGRITQGRLAGAVMLIMTSTGAKTGLPRTVPLGYHRDGERYVLVGSNNGRDEQPEWLANLRKNPITTVEVGTETFQARATVTDGSERRRLLDARIAAVPIFGDYERKAKRELPVIVLERID